jgi:hypothetical protein
MKKVTIRDSRRRNHFSEILNEWCDVVSRYTNEFCTGDALYWYNERASLSSFASAAARKDYHVLEEYSTDKKGEESGDTYTGRADLYLAKGKTEYIFEAKQQWVSISDRAASPSVKIGKSLRAARKDAASSNVNKVPVYGIVFAVPYIKKSFHENKEELLQNFIKGLSDIDFDALAYVFPEKAETINKSGTFFPGVACLIRAPRRKP